MSHDDVVHDVQPDFYGKRVASCSSDRTIKIHSILQNNSHVLLATLPGHQGPVWQLSWAHPKFGSRLASCSYDQHVFVWAESADNKWAVSTAYTGHKASVNAISFAPMEYGFVLACASSDEHVSVLKFHPDLTTFEPLKFRAHSIGVNAVSWAPYRTNAPLRLASAGCDNLAVVWRNNVETGQWDKEAALQGHTDWVRDVAWCPNVALPYDLIATCSQDKTVRFFKKEGSNWAPVQEYQSDEVVYRLSWNLTGTILAVTSADGKVTLLKEDGNNEWNAVQFV